MKPEEQNTKRHFARSRIITSAVKRTCERYGIFYQSYSNDWVFILSKDERIHSICGYALGLNSDAVRGIAQDKVASYLILQSAGIVAVPHYLLSSIDKPEIDIAVLEKTFKENTEVVIKPLMGGAGRLVAKFRSLKEAVKYMQTSNETEWAASPFMDIEKELRFVVLDGDLQFCFEKYRPGVVDGLKMFNLNRGTVTSVLDIQNVSEDLTNLALQAFTAIGLRVGAVDIVLDSDGNASVLEINANFSLDHFAELSYSNRKLALDFYEKVILAQLKITK